MLRIVPSLVAAALLFGGPDRTAVAQDAAVRFDRPVFTTESTVLCPRQYDITLLRRASDDNDRAAFERLAGTACKLPGPDIRLTVVTSPGLYDPVVEVRAGGGAQNLGPGVPRGKVWTLKTMLRN